MKQESGTSYLGTGTCSSYMLSEQSTSLVGMKADDGLSHEASMGRLAIQCFPNNADLLSPTSSACNGRNISTSEMSTMFSACSSQDSFSENQDISTPLRVSVIIVNLETPVNEQPCQNILQNSGSTLSSQSHDSKIFLNQPQKKRELESFADNSSCISCLECVDKIAGDHNSDTDRKNASCSSASVESFHAMENTVNDRLDALCSIASGHFVAVDNNQHGSLIKVTKESPPATAVFSKISDVSEISILRDSCIGSGSSRGEPSELFEEQVESSLTSAATYRIHGQIQDVQCDIESLKPEIEMNDGEVATKAAECSDKKEHFQRLDGVDETITQPPSLKVQLINHHDESDNVEDEVQVCDICGDVGRVEYLATCSRCSDGAEHIYCMRIKLDSVPEGNWMCEECMLVDENEKKTQDQFANKSIVKCEESCLNETRQNSGKCGPDKRLMGSLKDFPVAKKRALEDHVTKKRAVQEIGNLSVMSKPCDKAVMSRSLSFKNLDKRKTNSGYRATSFGSLFKSKSFNAIRPKVKFNQSEGGAEKPYLSREMTPCPNVKEGAASLVCKTTSFKDSIAERAEVVDTRVKKLSSDFSQAKAFNRLRLGKGRNLIIEKNKSHFELVREAGNGASASMRGKKAPLHGETVLALSSRSSHHDMIVAPGGKESKNPSKSTVEPAHGDYTNEEQNMFTNGARKDIEYSTDAIIVTKSNNLIGSSVELSSPKGLLGVGSAVGIPSWISTVPQFKYIWEGGFEIQGSGTLQGSCDGIQAHLSTCSSSKVCELAHKLPHKILLEQVPRLAVWPTQFVESQAKEDNIALYFFANDIERYERNYKILLNYMTKEDLGLMGNFDGVELLIFSSNLLPENFRCWNNLLFLWGVFRGRKINCSQNMQCPPRMTSVSDLNVGPSGSPNLCSSAQSSQVLYNCNTPCSAPKVPNSSISPEVPALTSGGLHKICENKISSRWKFSGIQSSDQWLSTVDSLMKSEQLSGELKLSDDSPKKERAEIDLNTVCETDAVRLEGGREGKRMESFIGVPEADNIFSDTRYLIDRFSCGTGSIYPVSGKDQSQRPSGALGSSMFSADMGSVDCRIGAMRTQLQAASVNGGKWSESGIPELELSLGAGRKAEQGVASQFPEMVDYKKKRKSSIAPTNNGNDECLTSLTLSLGLPVSGVQPALKQGSETKLSLPKRRLVDTRLSLSGGIGNC